MTSDHQSRYNSTIIAEELSQVLLIDKELYLRSFGVNNLEWQRKMQFVNQSPLFQSLMPAIRNLLMESLKPLEIQFGNRFVKQGNVCNSLYFICQGWGKVIAEVRTSMIQYEAMIASKKVKGKSSGRRTIVLKELAIPVKSSIQVALSQSLKGVGTDSSMAMLQ